MIRGSFAMEQQSNREWTRTHGFLRNSKNPRRSAEEQFFAFFFVVKKEGRQERLAEPLAKPKLKAHQRCASTFSRVKK